MLLTTARGRPNVAMPVLIFAILPLLSGCVIYEEHVTLDDKGGAAVEIQLDEHAIANVAPEAADPVVIKALLVHSMPNSISLSVEKKNGGVHVSINAAKVADLIAWAGKEENPLGIANVQVIDGYMDVTRTLGAIKAFDFKELDKNPGATVVFKLTGPGTIVSSNATRTEGSTAIWEFDPREVLSEGAKPLAARFKVSTPWLTYSLIVLMVLGVCAVLYFALRKRKI